MINKHILRFCNLLLPPKYKLFNLPGPKSDALLKKNSIYIGHLLVTEDSFKRHLTEMYCFSQWKE